MTEKRAVRHHLVWAFVPMMSSCVLTHPAEPSAQADPISDDFVSELIDTYGVAGVGVAIIRNGTVVYQDAFGEQEPGVPATLSTVFNTASVAKTVTAETLLALAETDMIDLDEPIAPYVDHEQLSHDPRYASLTPRILMSHQSGLRNWPHSYEDGVLRIEHEPGERFSYSGAGVELAARYAVEKTGEEWRTLVRRNVFEPAGVEEAALGELPPWTEGRMAVPMDAEGQYRSIAELNPGLSVGDADAAADDLVITVPAYAKLIDAILSGDVLEGRMTDRTTLESSFAEDPIYQCEGLGEGLCPDSYGHSIGWQLFEWGDHQVITHSGSDQGENALVHFSPDTGDGGVIFINGANGWPVMTRILGAIGDEPQLANYYRALLKERLGIVIPTAEADIARQAGIEAAE